MVRTQNQIRGLQLFSLLFISRSVGVFTYMIRLQSSIDTGGSILVIGFYLLFSILFAIPVLIYLTKQQKTDLLTGASFVSQRFASIIGLFYAVIFLLAAIITIARFGLFAGTVLLQQSNLRIFIFALLIASVYSAAKGLEPMARTGVIFTFILLFSLIFTSASTLSEFNAANITVPQSVHLADIVKQAFVSACRNIEITALLFIAPQIKGSISKITVCHIIFFSILTAMIITVAGGVMGDYGEQQMYPLYTLSVLAKFGFLERTDDLQTGIWVVCTMLKIAFLLYASVLSANKSLQKQLHFKHYAIGGIVIFAGYLLLSANIEMLVKTITSNLMPIFFLTATVLIPLTVTFAVRRKEIKQQKEKSK